MITDARTLGGVFILRCDVCIVGAGPAGISIARELGRRGLDVILLDSGGKKFDKAAHDLDKGTTSDSVSHGPLEDYRRRRLGGATTAWGGRCVPFDEIDFEPRDFVPHSGWPLRKRDLDPYYVRAHEYLELGPYTYSARESLAGDAAEQPMIPGLRDPELTMDALYRFSPPTNFGTRFEQDLADSPNVRVLLHATAQELVLDRDGNTVERLTIVSTGGHKLTL
ncbi:MAG: GMC family oxidoreductase, partial [Myxococcales bacterium]|nr:GMC family oxidoreductase [Myxococcales bacterium]